MPTIAHRLVVRLCLLKDLQDVLTGTTLGFCLLVQDLLLELIVVRSAPLQSHCNSVEMLARLCLRRLRARRGHLV